MSSFVTIYALLWTVVLVVAPIACAYTLIKASTPLTRGRSSGIAILGLLLSALLVFGLATTTLQPLAIMFLPAPLVFAFAILIPSILFQKGVRAYLVSSMAAAEMFSIWMCWSTLMRSRP